MYKEIEIELADGTVQMMPFKACGTTSIRYHQFTRSEILKDVAIPNTPDNYYALDSAYSKLAYIMNKQATAKTVADMNNINEDDYFEWLENFASLEFATKSAQLLDIYLNNKETTVDSKKNPGQQTES